MISVNVDNEILTSKSVVLLLALLLCFLPVTAGPGPGPAVSLLCCCCSSSHTPVDCLVHYSDLLSVLLLLSLQPFLQLVLFSLGLSCQQHLTCLRLTWSVKAPHNRHLQHLTSGLQHGRTAQFSTLRMRNKQTNQTNTNHDAIKWWGGKNRIYISWSYIVLQHNIKKKNFFQNWDLSLNFNSSIIIFQFSDSILCLCLTKVVGINECVTLVPPRL